MHSDVVILSSMTKFSASKIIISESYNDYLYETVTFIFFQQFNKVVFCILFSTETQKNQSFLVYDGKSREPFYTSTLYLFLT